jgi:hypothetical protein
VFSGRLRLPVTVSASTSLSRLIATGVQIAVEDLGSGGQSLFDLTRRAASVPGPGDVSPEGCDATRDLWTPRSELHGVGDKIGGFTYRNESTALPAAGCAPGSAKGLQRIELVDRRSTAGTIDFRILVQNTGLAAPVGPLRGTLVLGTAVADGLGSRCGVVAFAPEDCALGNEGHELTCPPAR